MDAKKDLFEKTVENETDSIPANLTVSHQELKAYLKTIIEMQIDILELLSKANREEIEAGVMLRFKEALNSTSRN